MNDGGIDTSFVHQVDGLLRGKGRHLPMREVARQTSSPEMNLGVDDLHLTLPPPLSRSRRRGRPASLEHLADRGDDPLAVGKDVIFEDGAVGYRHLQGA